MELDTVIGLAGLALIDSLSIGTLLIPVALLVLPNVPRRGIIAYIAAISVFYFAVGLVLLAAADQLWGGISAASESRAGLWVQFVVGAGMFIAAFVINPGRTNAGDDTTSEAIVPSRWEPRLRAVASVPGMLALAVTAGALELATMAPYLGAIGILTASDVSVGVQMGVLAGYVAVMSLPAVILLVARVALGSRADAPMRRFGVWLGAEAAATFPWILGILGWFIGGAAAGELFF